MALPSRLIGLKARANSKDVRAAMPVVGMTRTRTTSSHSGARPGHPSTNPQTTIVTATKPREMRLR